MLTDAVSRQEKGRNKNFGRSNMSRGLIYLRSNSYKILKILFFVLFSSLLFNTPVFAQGKGVIRGKVIDKTNNEPLILTNVLVVGSNLGASADLDGNYTIRNLAPGEYDLRFTYISYQTVIINNVMVKPGQETIVNIALSPAALEMNEVMVTAEALKTSELVVVNLQKSSDKIVDGISAELIKKNDSSDGTDVLKRLTGVTIAGGKFAYIRGVSDRYNNTLLNGSSLPSTDPEKRSFSYDFFPANLIENLLTSKTSTPDKPADFSGGMIEINTIEFPATRIFNISTSTSYNTMTNYNNFTTYSGGDHDWLGWDDGTRALPSLVTSKKIGKGNYTPEQLQQIGLAFRNNWQTMNTNAPMKGNFKLSYGNSHSIKNNLLGYIISLNYANSDETSELEKNNYTFEGPRYQYKGHNYANTVSWSSMLNTSFKLGHNHKFSLKNLYNQHADNETTIYEGAYYYYPDYRKVTSLRYISRTLYSSQLIGEHYFSMFKGMSLNWNINYGNSTRNEPDARRYVYSRDLDQTDANYRFLLDQSVSTRFFGNLDDINNGANFDISFKLFKNPSLPRIKFGALYNGKERDFQARTLGFRNLPGGNFTTENALMTASVEEIFNPENIGGKFIEIIEITKPSDSYTSDEQIYAGYLMTDFDLYSRLKVVTGVRFEKSRQNLHSFTSTNDSLTITHDNDDWLPSININYSLTSNMNIRAAFTKTLARPEFRELAPYSYFDFQANELVEGNPDLKRSTIVNYDLRFEIYPGRSEIFAISGFAKQFTDPIEQILMAASGFEPIRSYQNADKAISYGVELELRKQLGSISQKFNNLSFAGNISFIQSEIDLKGKNVFQEDKRPLQGQADYISNVGLYYEDMKGKFSASVIYNRVGEKIARVGFANLSNIIELPREQVDVTFATKLTNYLNFKFAAKDVFNQDYKFIQRTLEGDKTAELRKTGRTFSLGLSYQM